MHQAHKFLYDFTSLRRVIHIYFSFSPGLKKCAYAHMLVQETDNSRRTSRWTQPDSIHDVKALVNLAQRFVSLRRETFLTQVASGLTLFRQLQILRDLRQKDSFCLFDFFTDPKSKQTPGLKLQHRTSWRNCTKITPNAMWWKNEIQFCTHKLKKMEYAHQEGNKEAT